MLIPTIAVAAMLLFFVIVPPVTSIGLIAFSKPYQHVLTIPLALVLFVCWGICMFGLPDIALGLTTIAGI